MANEQNLQLFGPIDTTLTATGPSPSEAFDIAHPDLITAPQTRAVTDPNERNIRNATRSDMGGGIVAGLAGDLDFQNSTDIITPVHVASTRPVRVRRTRESRYGDSERDTGSPDYHKPYRKLTDEEVTEGLAGLAIARDILANREPAEPVADRKTGTPIPQENIEAGVKGLAAIREQNPRYNSPKK